MIGTDECLAISSSASAALAKNRFLSKRSCGGYPDSTNSGKTTSSAPMDTDLL